MNIEFYVGKTWENVRPEMLTGPGCGGSEVALIKMAEELCKLGHQVTVWGPHAGEYNYDGGTVVYRHFNLYRLSDDVAPDVTVMWRNIEPVMREHPGGKTVLWLHDLGLPELPPEIAARIDYLFCLSQFHANSILANNPLLADKLYLTDNGINMDLYPDDPETAADSIARMNRFIYSSSPRRGLGKLLREWPAVREKFPEAELHIAYGFELSISMCEKVGNQREADIYRSMLKAIEKGIPGVVYHGRLNQLELAALQRSCFAWLYPPNDFEETYCITALEAMAAKLRIASRDNGALPETLNNFWVWHEGVHTKDAIKRLYLQDWDLEENLIQHNYNYVKDKTWANIAKEWTERLSQ